jgi:phosphotriesterase-related protein
MLSVAQEKVVLTVTGPVDVEELGPTLPHEHVIVDFIGADSIRPGRYNTDTVFKKMLPLLNDLKAQGCKTMFDCTPDYLGRDVRLLEKLSKASGVNIVTPTGYYGAVKQKYFPKLVFTETAQQIADMWIKEFISGIDGTGIKPGFIKLSADEGPLTPVQRKVIEAGAIANKKTGLTIAVHSGNGSAAREELSILMKGGVLPEDFIWVHAQNEKDTNIFKEIAGKGAWVEFDGLNDNEVLQYVSFLKFMKENKLLHRTLISHDAGYYSVGEPNSGQIRKYTTLFVKLIPSLKEAGFTDADIQMLTITNPADAFAIIK